MKKLSIIIPCYFNQDNVKPTFVTIKNELDQLKNELDFEVVFVDDGSKDRTFEVLLELKREFPAYVKIVKLVTNVGSYIAIVAGLRNAEGSNCYTVISADLQDPPELIRSMYQEWKS